MWSAAGILLSVYRGVRLEAQTWLLVRRDGAVSAVKRPQLGVVVCATELANEHHFAIAYVADLLHRRVCVFYGDPSRHLDAATVDACVASLRAATGLLVVYLISDQVGVADAVCFPAADAVQPTEFADAARAVWVLKALGGWDEAPVMHVTINNRPVDIHADLPTPQQGWQLELKWR